jgi:hypothetical protein
MRNERRMSQDRDLGFGMGLFAVATILLKLSIRLKAYDLL